jgi:hypothetical protein
MRRKRYRSTFASVSFFNELATEKRNYARGCFLIMASKRIMLWKDTMSRDKTRSWLPRDLHHGWKIITLEGTHVEGRDRGKEIRLQ